MLERAGEIRPLSKSFPSFPSIRSLMDSPEDKVFFAMSISGHELPMPAERMFL
jgi:hypothetical protein